MSRLIPPFLDTFWSMIELDTVNQPPLWSLGSGYVAVERRCAVRHSNWNIPSFVRNKILNVEIWPKGLWFRLTFRFEFVQMKWNEICLTFLRIWGRWLRHTSTYHRENYVNFKIICRSYYCLHSNRKVIFPSKFNHFYK